MLEIEAEFVLIIMGRNYRKLEFFRVNDKFFVQKFGFLVKKLLERHGIVKILLLYVKLVDLDYCFSHFLTSHNHQEVLEAIAHHFV
jgi:hypothetical protein